jgi:hypothetical protein
VMLVGVCVFVGDGVPGCFQYFLGVGFGPVGGRVIWKGLRFAKSNAENDRLVNVAL